MFAHPLYIETLNDQYNAASPEDRLEIKKCMAQYWVSIQNDLEIGPNLFGYLEGAARAQFGYLEGAARAQSGPSLASFESAKSRASELIAELARSDSPPSAPPLPAPSDGKGGAGAAVGGGSGGGAGPGYDEAPEVEKVPTGAPVVPSPTTSFLTRLQSGDKERFILAESFIRQFLSPETLISMEVIRVLLGSPVLAAIHDPAILSEMAKAMLRGVPSPEAAPSMAILILNTEPASLSSQVRAAVEAVMPSEVRPAVACLDWKAGAAGHGGHCSLEKSTMPE